MQVRNLLGGGPCLDAAHDGEPDDERPPHDPGHGDGGRSGLACALSEERSEQLFRGYDADSDGEYGDDREDRVI